MATADLLQVILFSHRGVFTPVCTPEFGEVACRASEFANCNVKIIGISAISLEDHYRWIQDINDYGSKVGPIDVQFPIVNTCPFDPFSALVTSLGIRTQIADEDRKTSTLYDISQRQRSSFYGMSPPLKKSKSNSFATDSHSFCDRQRRSFVLQSPILCQQAGISMRFYN